MPAAPLDASPTARQARARRLSAERSRRYRRRLAATGTPGVRAVDAAIAEALALLFARTPANALAPQASSVPVAELLLAAVTALVRDGANRAAAVGAVTRRLEPRAAHRDPYALLTVREGRNYERLCHRPDLLDGAKADVRLGSGAQGKAQPIRL